MAPTAAPQPWLEGRRVRLRPVRIQDYDWLASYSQLPELAFRWRGQVPGSIDPQALGQYLWNGVFCQFVIEASTSGVPLGLAVAYGADLANQHVYIAMVLDPRSRARGWPLEAGGLFIDYLFQVAEFRKIYGEGLDFNATAYSSAVSDGLLREEGRLREHTFAGGAWRDKFIYAIYRSDWLGGGPRRLAREDRRKQLEGNTP